ncbi:MLO-like protein 13 isoform X2 [Impatiens glandulifera]|nr:MLO-like protein 13 isoform X2 [Impatiens glandulifera]
MLLGFISLLLTVFQGLIGKMCLPTHFASYMLPCKMESTSASASEPEHMQYFKETMSNGRRLLSTGGGGAYCANKGKVPLMSLEALHQLHIFIFVLAVVHMIFCASTMVLGGLKINEWKKWEDSVRSEIVKKRPGHGHHDIFHHHQLFKQRATGGYWRRAAVVSYLRAFFKQFKGSVTQSDYIALRSGFIKTHCPGKPDFDFHKYILRTLEIDFKKIVGISWYLWLFVVLFLLVNLAGWHTYFWLAFLPLVLVLLVGAKLEHIISRLAGEVAEKKPGDQEAQQVKPSNDHFWFGRPKLIIYLIHFILFQNSFEMAFIFWIWATYGFNSCMMENLGFTIPRLVIGVIVQLLCSYSTLPLYALVTQMGSMFKQGIFDEYVHDLISKWRSGASRADTDSINRMIREPIEDNQIIEQIHHPDSVERNLATTSVIELSYPNPNT